MATVDIAKKKKELGKILKKEMVAQELTHHAIQVAMKRTENAKSYPAITQLDNIFAGKSDFTFHVMALITRRLGLTIKVCRGDETLLEI